MSAEGKASTSSQDAIVQVAGQTWRLEQKGGEAHALYLRTDAEEERWQLLWQRPLTHTSWNFYIIHIDGEQRVVVAQILPSGYGLLATSKDLFDQFQLRQNLAFLSDESDCGKEYPLPLHTNGPEAVSFRQKIVDDCLKLKTNRQRREEKTAEQLLKRERRPFWAHWFNRWVKMEGLPVSEKEWRRLPRGEIAILLDDDGKINKIFTRSDSLRLREQFFFSRQVISLEPPPQEEEGPDVDVASFSGKAHFAIAGKQRVHKLPVASYEELKVIQNGEVQHPATDDSTTIFFLTQEEDGRWQLWKWKKKKGVEKTKLAPEQLLVGKRALREAGLWSN